MIVAKPNRHVRKTDPITSVCAAEHAKLFSASHGEVIHAALVAHGPQTAHELQARTRLTVVQIDRRLPDLREAGRARVVRVGGIDQTREGFRVWEAVS